MRERLPRELRDMIYKEIWTPVYTRTAISTRRTPEFVDCIGYYHQDTYEDTDEDSYEDTDEDSYEEPDEDPYEFVDYAGYHHEDPSILVPGPSELLGLYKLNPQLVKTSKGLAAIEVARYLSAFLEPHILASHLIGEEAAREAAEYFYRAIPATLVMPTKVGAQEELSLS
jgi:hypothetical protein